MFNNGLAHLKAEKDEVEGTGDDLPVYIRQWTCPPEGREGGSTVEGQEHDLPVYIFDNGLTQLKAEKDEVEDKKNLPVYIRQWTRPPEGREG
jgi:hypothetical protein